MPNCLRDSRILFRVVMLALLAAGADAQSVAIDLPGAQARAAVAGKASELAKLSVTAASA
jgi:hypothetical protein